MRSFRMLAVVAVASAVMAGATSRATAESVLTFDGQPTGLFTSLTENGYRLNFVGFGDRQMVSDLGGGNNALLDSDPGNASGAEVTITRLDGRSFSLISMDIANLNNPGGGPFEVETDENSRVQLTSGGGDRIAYRTGSSTFSTIRPSGFTKIHSLSLNIVSGFELDSDGNLFPLTLAVDNIHLRAVPEPSSLVLASIGGLAGLGVWLRRRRRTA
ncbi:PEP-CTERM sorting domain-containing protein [Tautonia rosea]|uniref:PEP-CTERM sorting domain-containing protein n=1 Tax=Tautonia rosea TaxID=2728037 RepID=UPI0014754B80|nr:PEP-CTERM sorting domain-containing protein [Tautonia rosea]